MESFGKTIAESMACGTPVVCFGTTGQLDIVDHKINGYCAKPYESEDLAKGIDWLVNLSVYNKIRQLGIKKIRECFGMVDIANKHLVVYKRLIELEN
jgi:glycosyltransferase involved in cell wall biosynthesis